MIRYSKRANKYYFREKEITEKEYREILDLIQSKPEAPEGYGYRLKDDLTWELYKVEIPTDEIPTDEDYMEAGKILLGVSE